VSSGVGDTDGRSAGQKSEQIAAAQQLAALLPGTIERLKQLQEALLAERRALASSDAGAIQASAQAKEDLLTELETHNQRLYALLPTLGFSADADGLGAWLERAVSGKGRAAVEPLQRALREALEACRDTNLGNGLLVGAGARDAQTLLGMLTGAGGEAVTYDARGVQSAGATGPGRSRPA
jgi:flagellar biosynthesis/type III secretory pathway chaperone